jgi:hypothetical protein
LPILSLTVIPMTKRYDDLGIADTSGLTDADWPEINKLKRAYDEGGDKAMSRALEELQKDPVRAIRVLGAFFPERVREALKDAAAELGITEDDIRDLARKFDPPPTKQ